MKQYTDNENEYFDDIEWRDAELRQFFTCESLPSRQDVKKMFVYIEELRTILGNGANLQSFLAVLLAKDYLLEHFEIENFDAAAKAQGAPGLDIDVQDQSGHRIIGEIKTTMPYKRNDFGSAQLTSIRKDFAKLNGADAQHKFFFVTDRRAYNYVMTKYRDEIPGVEVVLLIEHPV